VNRFFWLKLDLEEIASIRSAVEEFTSKENQLHILMENAGVMATPFSLTKDGFENQWGTNVVGHFALLKLLLPTLQKTVDSSHPGDVRVVMTSSAGHAMAPKEGIVLENTALENYNTWTRYGQSKLGNILTSKELAKRYADKGIWSLSVHPGVVDTELVRGPAASYPLLGSLTKLSSYFSLTAHQGALTQLYAATSPLVVERQQNGAYLIPFAREHVPSKQAIDTSLALKLWDHLEEQVKDKLQ